MEYEYKATKDNLLLVLAALYAAGWRAYGAPRSALEASINLKDYPVLHLYTDNKTIGGNEGVRGFGPLLDDQGLALLIAGKSPLTEIRLNGAYTAVISPDKKTVTVGCQTFDRDAILKVAEALKS